MCYCFFLSGRKLLILKKILTNFQRTWTTDPAVFLVDLADSSSCFATALENRSRPGNQAVALRPPCPPWKDGVTELLDEGMEWVVEEMATEQLTKHHPAEATGSVEVT